MHKILTLGLNNSNPLVRALSLTGLRSVFMEPKKVREALAPPGGLSAGGGIWKKASMTGGLEGGRTGEGCSV